MIMMSRFVMASGSVAVLLPAGALGQVMDYQYLAIYESRCASCHGNVSSDPNSPSREVLQAFSPERVLEALTTGPMAPNATGLTDEQKWGLAEYLTGRPLGRLADRSADAMPNRCTSGMPMGDPMSGPRRRSPSAPRVRKHLALPELPWGYRCERGTGSWAP